MADEQCHYFIIGPRQEKIAVPIDNWQTCSHMLGDMKLDEDSLEMPDLDPVAFKIFLQYASGTKNLGSNWKTQTVFDVCYLANKFHLNDLRETAAQLLWPFGVFEVFNALRCVVEYKAICIEPAVRKIVQEETTLMFEQPQFNSLDKECLLYILTQDILNADELAVWKAVLGWARHQAPERAEEENIPVRTVPEEALKLIRFHVLTPEEFKIEVEQSGMLSAQEIQNYNSTETKTYLIERKKPLPLLSLYYTHDGSNSTMNTKKSSLYIVVNNAKMKLRGLLCYGKNWSEDRYRVTGTFTLSQYNYYQYSEKAKHSFTIDVSPNEPILIDLADKQLVMPADCSQYKLDLEFDEPHPARTLDIITNSGHLSDIGRLRWISCAINPNIKDPPTVTYYSHVGKLYYETFD